VLVPTKYTGRKYKFGNERNFSLSKNNNGDSSSAKRVTQLVA